MQPEQIYYFLTEDEYKSLSSEELTAILKIKRIVQERLEKAYSALAEVLIAKESAKGDSLDWKDYKQEIAEELNDNYEDERIYDEESAKGD